MKKPVVFRKRFIPDEIVDISGDELLYRDEKLLITRWNPIKPRKDISKGVSYTFLDKGYKISRFYDGNQNFAYWYCDIIRVDYDANEDRYVLTDLLVDVKQWADGKMRILDMEELAHALRDGVIGQEEAVEALQKLNDLLELFYEELFPPDVCRDPAYWR